MVSAWGGEPDVAIIPSPAPAPSAKSTKEKEAKEGKEGKDVDVKTEAGAMVGGLVVAANGDTASPGPDVMMGEAASSNAVSSPPHKGDGEKDGNDAKDGEEKKEGEIKPKPSRPSRPRAKAKAVAAAAKKRDTHETVAKHVLRCTKAEALLRQGRYLKSSQEVQRTWQMVEELQSRCVQLRSKAGAKGHMTYGQVQAHEKFVRIQVALLAVEAAMPPLSIPAEARWAPVVPGGADDGVVGEGSDAGGSQWRRIQWLQHIKTATSAYHLWQAQFILEVSQRAVVVVRTHVRWIPSCVRWILHVGTHVRHMFHVVPLKDRNI